MKKPLIIVSAIVVLLAVFTLIYNYSNRDITDINEFVPKVVESPYMIPFKVGQQFGDSTVSGLDVKAIGDYSIQFVGTTTVTGVFREGLIENDPKTLSGFIIDAADVNKIPTAPDEDGAPTNIFFFRNAPARDIAKGMDYGQRHTIVIANYRLFHVGAEGGNSADFVKFVK
jgi:hypothetical protein